MLDWWTPFCLKAMDFLVGGLLHLPSDLCLLLIAVGTATLMVLVRRVTTNQEFLRQAEADRKRQKQLVRQARRRKDKDAVKRHKSVRLLIAAKSMKYELLPLLVAILPIAMLATWALNRLGHHPPEPGEEIVAAAYLPVSAAGRTAFLRPADGVALAGQSDSWARRVEAVTGEGPAHGLATWRISAEQAVADRTLVFALKGTYEHPFRVGGPVAPPAVVNHESGVVTELRLHPVKLFGVVPGIPWIEFPPWLVAYLVVAVPCVPLLKRVFRIH